MNHPERRYDDDEVARILERASETEELDRRAAGPRDGLTLAEVQDIAREVGIPSAAVEREATALDRPQAGPRPVRRFLGTPIGVGRTVELDRRLTDGEWGTLVSDLRETFDARGRVREDGAFRQWTNGNLQALLEPTPTGERLRLSTLKSDARPTLGFGAVLFLGGVVALILEWLTGGVTIPARSLMLPLLAAATGGALITSARIRLPRWASTRELQMELVARRLVGRIEESAARLPGTEPGEGSDA